MKFTLNQKGFTLAELLIGMAIMVIVMAGVNGILHTSIKSFQYSQKRDYEIQQARAVFDIIVSDLKNATEITDPAKGNSQGQISYTTSSGSFTVSAGTGTNSKTVFRNTQKLTANIVSNISFTRDSSDGRLTAITIIVNDQENSSSGDYILTTTVFSQNVPK